MGETEPKGRKYTLEILKRVDRICREHQLQYTLLFGALLSQEEEEGNSNWLSGISIGLLYPDYEKLLRLIDESREENIYIFNREKDKDFNAFCTQICMRSRVELPKGREKDYPYYDYFIWAYPIVYAGDTKRDCQRLKRKIRYYGKCMEALAPAPYVKGLKRKTKALSKRYWCKKRKKEETKTELFFHSLLNADNPVTKYVCIFYGGKQRGVMCLAKTYEKTEECRFGNLIVSCIRDKEEWLHSCYSKKEKKIKMEKPVNRAVLEGPETIRRVQLVALENLCELDRICRKHHISYILSAGTLLGAVRHKGFIPWDDDVDVFMLNEEWQKFEKAAETELDKSRFFLRTQKTDLDNNLVFKQIKRNQTIYVKEGRDNFNIHRGIALDILPFYNSPDTRVMFWIQDKLCHFFKTMTWAHMGSISEKRLLPGIYYRLLARVSNKKSYALYEKFAGMVKEPKVYLSYLCVARNPYHKGFNQRKYFEDVCEIEFEGHYFPAPREYDEYLKYLYGNDYDKLPVPLSRVNHHLPGKIELNGLYEFDR